MAMTTVWLQEIEDFPMTPEERDDKIEVVVYVQIGWKSHEPVAVKLCELVVAFKEDAEFFQEPTGKVRPPMVIKPNGEGLDVVSLVLSFNRHPDLPKQITAALLKKEGMKLSMPDDDGGILKEEEPTWGQK